MNRKLTYPEIYARQPRLSQVKTLSRLPIITWAENIRSLHNVGSIFRTSDAVRVQELILSGFTPCPPRPEIEKTALGATDSVPWNYYSEAQTVFDRLRKEDIPVVVLEHTADSIRYTDFDWKLPVCLVLGNEVEGVSAGVVEQADFSVEIPMLGMKQSLNVSVAYGILVYHIAMRWLENHSKT